MQNLYQSLRSRLTQVMAAVSLSLLTMKPQREKVASPIVPSSSSEMYRTGLCHYHGLQGKVQNYTFAFEKFLQAAEFGDEEGMMMTALCYLKGHGVEESYDVALHWFETAANTGKCPHAKTELAKLIIDRLKETSLSSITDGIHNDKTSVEAPRSRAWSSVRSAFSVRTESVNEDGNATPFTPLPDEHQDLQYAVQLLLEAANEGHVEAKTVLGSVFASSGDLEQAAKWFSLASNGGSSKGTLALANLFLQEKSLVVHRHKAFSLFNIAAKNGQGEAYNGLGLCYESGIGCDTNLSESIRSFRKGAEQHQHVDAMYNLGYVLVKNAIEVLDNMKRVKGAAKLKGGSRYIPSDVDESESQVEDQGEESPPEALAIYIDMGLRTDRALEEGVRWLRAAAEHRKADASFQLGRLYEQAIGVPGDIHAALANYESAAGQGHARAALFAANLLYAHHGLYEQDAIEKAARYYAQAARAGLPDAMNSYALLLEDGRAGKLTSEGNIKDIHAAATWYYEASQLDHPDAHLNLALLLATEPQIYAIHTLAGDIIPLPELARYLESQVPDSMVNDQVDTLRSLLEQMQSKIANSGGDPGAGSKTQTTSGATRTAGSGRGESQEYKASANSTSSSLPLYTPPNADANSLVLTESLIQAPRSSSSYRDSPQRHHVDVNSIASLNRSQHPPRGVNSKPQSLLQQSLSSEMHDSYYDE